MKIEITDESTEWGLDWLRFSDQPGWISVGAWYEL